MVCSRELSQAFVDFIKAVGNPGEGRQHFRVKVCGKGSPVALGDDVAAFLMIKSGLVDADVSQGIILVGDANDAGTEVDLLSLQAEGIAETSDYVDRLRVILHLLSEDNPEIDIAHGEHEDQQADEEMLGYD